MRVGFAMVAFALGCGRIGFDPTGSDLGIGIAFDAATIAPSCPESYDIQYESSRYRQLSAEQDWDAGERACEADGPGIHILIPDSSREQDALSAYVANGDDDVLIGLTDRISEDTYLLVTGEPARYTPWSMATVNRPSVDCALWLRGSYEFEDDACGASRVVLCECDGRLVARNSY